MLCGLGTSTLWALLTVSARPPIRIASCERQRLLAVSHRPRPTLLRGASMDALDVFRVKPDGSFVWIGSADSMHKALTVIRTLKREPSDAFLIHDWQENETLAVRTDKLPPA